jgi:hypothetical protein
MTSCCLILLALLLPTQGSLATVSGEILDREGKPMVGAQITYQKIGIVDRNIRSGDGSRSESPAMVEGTGRIYKVQTDKKGSFVMVGVDYGVYQIDITALYGSHVYSGKKTFGDINDPSSQNILNVDLSTIDGAVSPVSGMKTKEQVELIRQENARAA